MKRKIFVFGLSLALFWLAATVATVEASGHPQGIVTPTPGADGRIIYIVQDGQNCTSIATIAGIPLAQLRSLNRLDENCSLSVGQNLVIGLGGPSGSSPTPTEGPTPTATPLPATPVSSQGNAMVCVLLYEDLNGDALHQDTEGTIPDGAVSVTGTSGQYSQTANTTSSIDPLCFEKVLQGTYNISVAAPEGFNPTTQLNYTLDIKTGEQIYVDFGAQRGAAVNPQKPGGTEPSSNNLLGIAGGVLVLAALGLGMYAWLAFGRRSSSNMLKPPPR